MQRRTDMASRLMRTSVVGAVVALLALASRPLPAMGDDGDSTCNYGGGKCCSCVITGEGRESEITGCSKVDFDGASNCVVGGVEAGGVCSGNCSGGS